MPHSFTLEPRYEALVENLVRAGRYKDANEVVRDGLRLVEERETKLKQLDTAMARGLADAETGAVHTVDDVRARLQQRACRR